MTQLRHEVMKPILWVHQVTVADEATVAALIKTAKPFCDLEQYIRSSGNCHALNSHLQVGTVARSVSYQTDM